MEVTVIKTESISLSDIVIKDEELAVSEHIPKPLKKSERLWRCHEWVESQRNITYPIDEESDDGSKSDSYDDYDVPLSQLKINKKRKKTYDDSDDSTNESDCHQSKQLKRNPIKYLVIHHDCEWMGCRFTTTNYDIFKNHVKSHMHELLVKTSDDGSTFYVCLWDICRFETPDSKMIIRHVNYHSYDTRVKSIGKNVRSRLSLPGCLVDSRKRNQLPKLEFDFSCRWVECQLSFSAIQDYFDHIGCHVLGTTPDSSGIFICSWFGCKKGFKTITKLGYHLKSHSGEKVVGCANCGAKFRTNYAYTDHCEKQVPVRDGDFQCELCNKVFRKERYLMSHARKHINSHKCTFCDMTTNSPSALVLHIRYRHLNYRPFKCNQCDATTVTKSDLQSHMRSHTNNRQKKVSSKTFVCHCCDKTYRRGPYLSKHLLLVHGYTLPNGFSRFKYQVSEDGAYRLNPIRFESITGSTQEQDNKHIDGDKTDYQVMELSPATDNKPAKYVAVALTGVKISIQEMLATHNLNAENDDKKFMNNGNKIIDEKSESATVNVVKDKKNKKRVRKKKLADKTNNTDCDVSGECGVASSKKMIDEFSCIKRFNKNPNVKNVEISIAEVDLHGNIITTEIVESQEIIL